MYYKIILKLNEFCSNPQQDVQTKFIKPMKDRTYM